MDFLNLFGSSQHDKNDQFGPPGTQNEESGLLDPLLKLVGLKEDEQPDYFYDASQKYHDPYEYDYGDYLEGYQNYVKPPRQKTIPERISKWFAGFKVPSSGFKQVRNQISFIAFNIVKCSGLFFAFHAETIEKF